MLKTGTWVTKKTAFREDILQNYTNKFNIVKNIAK